MAVPLYLEHFRSGEMARRISVLKKLSTSCELCPRRCRVNRLEDEKGFCRTGRLALVSSYGPHFGEEDPLVGRGGSGTIFFTHCNLQCCFCQNYDISHQGVGHEVAAEELAGIMVYLQAQGCHNVNLVSPSHVVLPVMEALPLAVKDGLRIPIVFNSGGYDLPETLSLLEGIVDIYMPDYKFTDGQTAAQLARAPDYPEIVRLALQEMHRQVGDLLVDNSGVAGKGLLVRHLVLPEGQAGTEGALQWMASHLSIRTYLNIMDQYRPSGTAFEHPCLSRRITPAEYRQALLLAHRFGLERLDQRRLPRSI